MHAVQSDRGKRRKKNEVNENVTIGKRTQAFQKPVVYIHTMQSKSLWKENRKNIGIRKKTT